MPSFAQAAGPLRPGVTPRLAVALALAGLFLAALLNLREGVQFAMQYSQDFQWSPAVLLREGQDPYAWYLNGNAGQRIVMSQEPNYLHLLYVLLLPFASLTWPAAKGAWAVCNIAAGVGAAVWIARACGLRGVKFGFALLTFLAATPFAHVLGNGQQSLFVLFSMTAAWFWRGGAVGGLFFAAGAVKYSFAPALGLWWVLERRLAALGAAALASALAFAAFVGLSAAPPWTALWEPLRVSAEATHVGLGDVISLSRALGATGALPYALGLASIVLGVAALWRRRDVLNDIEVFAALNLLSLFSLFHHLYDYVALLPLFCRSLADTGVRRWASLAYVGYFWFVLKHIDSSPVMKSPAVIAATTLLSAATFVFLLSRNARTQPIGRPACGLLDERATLQEPAPCPSPTVSPPSASSFPNPPPPSPITSAR